MIECVKYEMFALVYAPFRQRVKYFYKNPYIPFHLEPGPGTRTEKPFVRFDEHLENFVCKGAFIRGLEKVKVDGDDVLWACGTFGSFPQAFIFNPHTLEPIRNVSVDDSLPTCARWPDEPMATKVAENGDMYVASGWGVYRPGKDGGKKNSTMLYSDWRMLTSGNRWLTRMAMVLGKDVTFIPTVVENKNYLYFFGREITPQLSYINTLSNEVTQSFMLRLCKNDIGYRYTADEDWPEIEKQRGNMSRLRGLYVQSIKDPLTIDLTKFSYSAKAYEETYQFPTKHFVSARKFPFGCYLKRYDGAQSLNRFWGEQNIMYFNRVADVDVFSDLASSEWVDQLGKYMNLNPRYMGYYEKITGLYISHNDIDPNTYVWQRMYGAFSSPGFNRRRRGDRRRSGSAPAHGAICQFALSEWKTDALVMDRHPPVSILKQRRVKYPAKDFQAMLAKNSRQFPIFRLLDSEVDMDKDGKSSIKKQYEEFMALFGSQQNDFYSRFSKWFQGTQIPKREGIDLHSLFNFTQSEVPLQAATDTGQCLNSSSTNSLTKEEFLSRMKLASTAWPTEWESSASKYFDATYHMNPVQVAGDNASFLVEGVEFAKMFVIKKNFTIGNNTDAPLVSMILVTTDAEVYRVVMCDLVSAASYITACEMSNTDQPYISKFYRPMRGVDVRHSSREKVVDGMGHRVRISSLLSVWSFSTEEDLKNITLDEQSPILKDAVYRKDKQRLYLLTARRLMSVSVSPEVVCKSYRTCVHCASDPECGWSKERNVCVLQGETGQPIQDVSNRGAKCVSLIEVETSEKRVKNDAKQPVALTCKNWKFFRGVVSWYVNGAIIDFRNSIQRLHYKETLNNALIIFPAVIKNEENNSPITFECRGTSIDSQKVTVLAKHTITIKAEEADERRRAVSRYNDLNEKARGAMFCVQAGGCTKFHETMAFLRRK